MLLVWWYATKVSSSIHSKHRSDNTYVLQQDHNWGGESIECWCCSIYTGWNFFVLSTCSQSPQNSFSKFSFCKIVIAVEVFSTGPSNISLKTHEHQHYWQWNWVEWYAETIFPKPISNTSPESCNIGCLIILFSNLPKILDWLQKKIL